MKSLEEKLRERNVSSSLIKHLIQEAENYLEVYETWEEINGYVIEQVREDLERLFSDLVVNKLARPAIATARDLAITCQQHLFNSSLDSSDEIKNAYERFILDISARVNVERCSPPIPTLTFHAGRGFDAIKESVGKLLWKRDDKFAIWLTGVMPYGPTITDFSEWQTYTVYVTVNSYGTEAAIQKTSQEVKNVMTSLLKSFYVIESHAYEDLFVERLRAFLSSNPEHPALETDDEKTEQVNRLLFLKNIADLISAYFDAPTKNDSMARRIRHSIHYLSQSDYQDQDEISLALSVTAIEALLCKKSTNVTDDFADHIAALLEPDLRHRFACIKFAKDLYALRSGVIHGSNIECSAEKLTHARIVAAAVLKAFSERRSFRRKGGYNDETPDELINDLKQGLFRPDQPTGVNDSPVKALWRSQS